MAQIILPEWLKEARPSPCPPGSGRKSRGFVEKTLRNIASVMKEALVSEEYAKRRGLLQGLETKARLAGFFVLIAAGASAGRAFMLLAIMVVAATLSYLSGVGLRALMRRVLPALAFTSVLVLPVFFDFITPGAELWVFEAGRLRAALTREGVETGLFFMLRVSSMASLASLLLLTTRQADFFRGLGRFVPSLFVTALFMTFRYALILLKIAEDSALARKSRCVKASGVGESQSWFATRSGLILKKSLSMAEEVNMAMASRGFTGKVKTFGTGPLRGRDYLWLGFTVFFLFMSFAY